MKQELIYSTLKIADLHATRLKYAMNKLAPEMPISGEKFTHLNDEDVLIFELFSSRFTKLQDIMGAKLFGLVLEFSKEPGEYIAFLDKLYKLEKLNIIPDAQKWLKLRDIRNHLSHEYPDDHDLNAKNFNEAFEEAHFLLDCLNRIKTYVDQIAKKVP